jgi:hypothetical protein
MICGVKDNLKEYIKAYGKGINYKDYITGWILFGRIFVKKGYEVHGIVRRSSILN